MSEMEYDVLRAIERASSRFTRSQHVVAQYLLSRPNECAMYTIQDLSARCGVSEASIVRFAQLLGFHGYQELRHGLQARLMHSISASKRIEETLEELDEDGRNLRAFVESQTEFIATITDTLRTETYRKICDHAAAAREVYLYGDGAAATPINAAAFWMTRVGVRTVSITTAGRRVFDQIIRADEHDFLICFLFGRAKHEALDLIDWMNSRGAPTAVITDVHDGSIVAAANHVLFVERGPAERFHSMAPPVILAETIALSVARRRGETAVEIARLLDETRDKYGLD